MDGEQIVHDVAEKLRALINEAEAKAAEIVSQAEADAKRIREQAQREISQITEGRVIVSIRVKVAKEWQRDPKQLGHLGF